MAIAGEDFDDAEEMTSKKLGERSACIDHSFGPSSRRHGHGSRCHGHRPSISRTSVRPRKVRTNTRPASRPRLMKDNSCAMVSTISAAGIFRCRRSARRAASPIWRRRVSTENRRAYASVCPAGRDRADGQPRGASEPSPCCRDFSSRPLVSFCRININALAQAHRQLSAGEGQIVAIMPDRQKFVADLKLRSNVPFPILTDMDNGYALSLNLTVWVGAEIQKMMEGRLDLPAFQGNDSWMLPIPATFVVGHDALIRARFIDPDYRSRMTIADMLAAMRL